MTPPDPNTDPRYAGVYTALEAQRSAAQRQRDLDVANAQTAAAYESALLQRSRPQAERTLNQGLLARGVFRGGEAQRRQGELAGDFMLREQGIQQNAVNRQNAADASLRTTFGNIDAQLATERGDAINRLNQAAFQAEERQRAIDEQNRRIAEDRQKAEEMRTARGVPSLGEPIYNTPDEYAAAANAYAEALARNQAAAQAGPVAGPRNPAPRRTPPPVTPRPRVLTPLNGPY